MKKEEYVENGTDLTTIITTAIKMPGVKVVRDAFLMEQFQGESRDKLELILRKGPIEAGYDRKFLHKKTMKLIKERTAFSTGASFLAGIPGGLAMAATIPADLLQFYAVALRMAQEIVYLYGEEDIWCDGTPDADKVTNQLILYCGVMFGATGAAQLVRVMSSALAKQALKKIPQMALTKTLYYPIIKSILKFFGVSLTKTTFAKGVSKVIPIVGGVVSGGITLASMYPMGTRLLTALDIAHFEYTNEQFNDDMKEIKRVSKENGTSEEEIIEVEIEEEPKNIQPKEDNSQIIFNKLKNVKQMYEDGLITEEEYKTIKVRLLEKIEI